MSQKRELSAEVVRAALAKSGEALSELAERRFDIKEIAMTYHEPEELPTLLGDAATPVCASFYEIRGELPGFLLLLMPVDQVKPFLEPLLGEACDDPAMADSTIGEIGNIVGSSFLNHIADSYRIFAAPTPPQVFRDMIGALLGSLAAVLVSAQESRVPILRTVFEQDEGFSSALLLWIPYSLSINELRNSS